MITSTEETRYILTNLDDETLDYLISHADDVYKVLNDLSGEQVFTNKEDSSL